MAAPDKIYLNKYMFRKGMMYPAPEANTPAPDIEYIRKDALVDWLKRKQDTTLIVVEDDLIQEVIDHINEM